MRLNDKERDKIIHKYYDNDAKLLNKAIDNIVTKKLHFKDIEISDFYSLGNEMFFKALNAFNGKGNFDGFLKFYLCGKFKTEMTYRNRKKRKSNHEAISFDLEVGEEGLTLKEVIASKEDNNMDREYSIEMKKYLDGLSTIQKEVLNYISLGYKQSEIIRLLDITDSEYSNAYNAIHSYRNTKVLLNLLK